MVSISTHSFRMAQKAPIRRNDNTNVEYQDWHLRDTSVKCRLRRWDVTYNFQLKKWTVVKYWTTQLPGETHYIMAPRKLAFAILLHLRAKYAIGHIIGHFR